MSDIVERLRKREHLFRAKFKQGAPDECWNWEGALSRNGYGLFSTDRRKATTAHRASMMYVVGDIPPEIEVCHKCDNRGCVNPNHLFLGTAKDNSQDRVRKGRQVTPNGERNGASKLKPQDVAAIRASSKRTNELAREFGVNHSLISQIRNRKIWTHV